MEVEREFRVFWENFPLELRHLVQLNSSHPDSPVDGADSLTETAQWKGVHKGSSLILFSLFFLCFLSFHFGFNFRVRSLFLISQYSRLKFKVLRWKTDCSHSVLSLCYYTHSKANFPEMRLTIIYQVVCCPVDECQISHFDWRTQASLIS